MESDPTRMCELLVGLPDVTVLGVDDDEGLPLRVHVETAGWATICPRCSAPLWTKERPVVELVDLPAFGRCTRLVWHKRRLTCASACGMGSFTEVAPEIAASRSSMTDRASRWATLQVGKLGRSVTEVAGDLGADWHAVNDAVMAYGTALVDDPDRIGEVTALGLDETLFCRHGRWRTQAWCTSIVDVSSDHPAQLLDVVPGRSAVGPSRWLSGRPAEWKEAIRYGVLDLSGPYRKTFEDQLEHAIQVADPLRGIPRNGSYGDPRIMREGAGLGAEWAARTGSGGTVWLDIIRRR